MADVELVIKIPERDYALACKYPDALIGTYAHYIKDGIPLPKCHGRLIDADALMRDYGNHDIELLLDNMDTIIKASKAESEE